MNDRAAGAIEALAWTRTVIENAKAKQQIEKVLDAILKCVAIDFHDRVLTR
jgi:hypothetical protein